MKSLQKYKCVLLLYNLMALGYIMHQICESLMLLWVCPVSGIPGADCTGDWSQPRWGRLAEAPIGICPGTLCILGIDCLRRGYFKEPKKVLVDFQTVCLAWSFGGRFSGGVAEGWRTKGVDLSHKEHHLTLPDSHPYTHSVTREPKSDQ